MTTKKVFVCGCGHQGMSMAAHLALNNVEVSLWNRTESNIKEILDTHEIHCNGVVEGTAHIDRVSTNIEDVISDFIMISTPSSAHADLAKLLAPYVHKDMTIILNPGRTFGAIEFAEVLKESGVVELPHIAETQTIVYTCRRNGPNEATIFALKNDVKIAALRGTSIDHVLDLMPDCLKPHYTPVSSVAFTSLANVGMILHCAPVLMNIGWIEAEDIGFKYYHQGISRSVANYLEKLDNERLAVAAALGFQIESTADWLRNTYGVTGNTLYECIQNNTSYEEIDAPAEIRYRYIMEDVPNGLVPMEHIGQELGVPTPNITTIINLASSALDMDFRAMGRTFSLEFLRDCL